MDILIFISTFFFMEFIAWFTHKYVMHGLLWTLHEEHHTGKNHGFFERNDSFFLIFATPGILCIVLGSFYAVPFTMAIGLGITAYGFCYFLVHDIFIHQRLNWWKNSDSSYLRAIRRAHGTHHRHIKKENGECFGMLFVPLKYFKTEMEKRH